MTSSTSCRICGEQTTYELASLMCCLTCVDLLDAAITMIRNVDLIIDDLEHYLETAAQPEIDCAPQELRDQVQPTLIALHRFHVGNILMQFALSEWDESSTAIRFGERLNGRTAADIKRQIRDDHAFRLIIDQIHRDGGEQK
jgi:hypothetical protein